jgi:predicted  nucleic acid-binding Zn-ribbon protein
LTPKDQIARLVRLQQLSTAARNGRQVVEQAPSRIEEIEARFRERNAEYVAVRDRHDELEADQRHRNGELETLEESRTKYRADLMQVQNQREYSAMLKEIDSIQAQISTHEEAVLRGMEELETLKVDLEKFAEHIEKEREAVAQERSDVEARVETAKAEIARAEAERARIEAELPRPLVAAVHRLEPSRQGMFLVKADDGTCMACYVRVRPQAYQEIRTASAIHSCSNCKRFLYYEPAVSDALGAAAPAAGEAADDSNGDGASTDPESPPQATMTAPEGAVAPETGAATPDAG